MSVTIRDVARHAGVSIATVSHVINKSAPVRPATEEKVMRAIRSLGYQPSYLAQGLVRNQTRSIGLIIPHRSDSFFSDPYFSLFLRGVSQVLTGEDYYLVLSLAEQSGRPTAFDQLAKQRRVDGLIVLCAPNDPDFVKRLLSTGLPTVVAGDIPDFLPANSSLRAVDVDLRSGAFQAVNHLVELGHRQIGFLSGPPPFSSSLRKEEGYRLALGQLPPLVAVGEYTEKSGYCLAKQLLTKHPEITALFAGNDLMALGAMRYLRDSNLAVPDDISVVGFDDTPFASYVQPSLTTVFQPVERLGNLAAAKMLEVIEEQEGSYYQEILPCSLVIRASSAPPPNRRSGG